jgi:hypothetical protein
VVLAALLSAVHVLTLALGLGAVYIRGRALVQPLDDNGWPPASRRGQRLGHGGGPVVRLRPRPPVLRRQGRRSTHNNFFWIK